MTEHEKTAARQFLIIGLILGIPLGIWMGIWIGWMIWE